jgi:ATP/maltotriose-dependent transcriptional regulator MalT
MQLILDKITPPSQAPRIARPRLLAMLQSNLNSRTCTIIRGRAGTGKTTLATDFACSSERAVAWYKVDASDTELRVFFDYLVASICRQRPDFHRDLIKSLAAHATVADIPQLADRLVFELIEEAGDPLLIVIEDLHLACDSEWLVPFLQRLLPLIPRDVHLLITSRTLPPAPFWRMRSKQMLEVIDETFLAFSRDEAASLFEGLGLSSEQARLALERTNGRAAALTEYVITMCQTPASLATVIAKTPKQNLGA